MTTPTFMTLKKLMVAPNIHDVTKVHDVTNDHDSINVLDGIRVDDVEINVDFYPNLITSRLVVHLKAIKFYGKNFLTDPSKIDNNS